MSEAATAKSPAMAARKRSATQQAKQLLEATRRRWGLAAWSLFGEGERERLLAYEFMGLLASQESDSNEALNHYRETARLLFGEVEVSRG